VSALQVAKPALAEGDSGSEDDYVPDQTNISFLACDNETLNRKVDTTKENSTNSKPRLNE
jgi:hypothetical protein